MITEYHIFKIILFLSKNKAIICIFLIHFSSGLPALSPHLKRLSTRCLQEQKKYLLDELEPIDICDFLFEEKAIEIMTHDNITETAKRRQQVEDLLQTLQENKNDCFHYFLYIIEKNKFNDIRNVLERRFNSEDVRDGIYNLEITFNF